MSMDEIIAVVDAPPPVDMQRDTPLLSARHDDVCCLRGHCDRTAIYLDRHLDDLRNNLLDDLRHDLSRKETYIHCLDSCCFFFFCHAITTVLLSISCCCRCTTSMLKTPDRLEPTTRTQKLFVFFAKNLSKLWVTAMLIFFVRWFLFRPIDVKPHLGASTVHELELQSPASVGVSSSPATPHLRFNLTTYLLFKNGHDFYKVGYDYLAVSVLYADVKLGPVDDELPSFTQEPHGSTVMRLLFVGRLRNASSTVEETFARERVQGLLQMVVRIRVTLTYRFWPFKAEYFTIYDCPLHSPFPQIGEPAVSSSAWCKAVTLDT